MLNDMQKEIVVGGYIYVLKEPVAAKSEYFSKLGKKGGPARALALSPRRRKQIAMKANAVRWGKLPTVTP